MLLVLTGSGCSGKSTLAFAVAGRLRQVAVHDFDEVGVPPGADLRWRQRMTEHWVRRALEYQDDGIDLLLPGQSPLGEVLAGPSAPRLDGVAVCLVDVADDVAGRGLRPTVLRSPLARSSTGPRGTVATRMTRSTGLPSSSRAAGRRWPGTGGTGGSRRIRGGPAAARTTGRTIAESARELEQWVTRSGRPITPGRCP